MCGRLALGMIAVGIALGAEARLAPLPEAQEADVIDAVYRVDGVGRSQVVFELPRGPRTITSLHWEPAPDAPEAVWRAARLRIVWDGVEPEAAGVDLPLGRFFELDPPRAADADDSPRADETETPDGHGAAAPSDRRVFRHAAPMPYRSGGRLILESHGRLKGTFRIRCEPSGMDLEGLGYYRAALEPEAAEEARSDSETLPVRVWYDPKPGPRPDQTDAADGPANPV